MKQLKTYFEHSRKRKIGQSLLVCGAVDRTSLFDDNPKKRCSVFASSIYDVENCVLLETEGIAVFVGVTMCGYLPATNLINKGLNG